MVPFGWHGRVVRRYNLVKTYGEFIHALEEELQVAIAEAEDLGFHHAADGPQLRHYQRLITWWMEVEMRARWYDDNKSKRRPSRSAPRTEAPDDLVGPQC